VNAVNDEPTLDAITDKNVNEDAPQQTVNLSGIGSGAANESQTLTVTASSSNTGLIPTPTITYTSPDATGTLKYTPVANQNGSATITVTVKDNGGTANPGDDDTVTRTFTITVNAINDAPVLTVMPVSVSAQYSDPLDVNAVTPGAQPVQISATDIDSPGTALTFSIKASDCLAAATLPNDLSRTDAAGSGAGTTADPGIRTATISGNLNVAPLAYQRCIVVSDGAASDTDVLTINVTQEDGRATYTGPMLVFTSPGGTTATIALKASVIDATASPALDAYEGNISNATVTFKDAGAPLTGCSDVPVILDSPSDIKVGTASCTATLSGLDAHTIDIAISGYYNGETKGAAVVEVAQPDGNFITGGGYLTMADSYGTFAGTVGSKMNFGFNVKYNKGTKPQPQGHVNIIVRAGGKLYQVKSTSITNLSLGFAQPCIGPPSPTCWGVATFESKANLTNLTDSLSLGGNNKLVISMTDKGEPGRDDSFAVTLYQGTSSTVLFSSSWTGTRTIEKLLGGGNLVVH
jgi:hypothetical protein